MGQRREHRRGLIIKTWASFDLIVGLFESRPKTGWGWLCK